MADFDFSFLIFVSGGSVAARRPSSVIPAAPQAMQGALQRVAVVSETTTLEFIESLLGTSVEVDRKATHDEAFAALAAGAVTYYFADRAHLNSVLGLADNAGPLLCAGNVLTPRPLRVPF